MKNKIQQQNITGEDVRSCTIYANLSDEEAEEVVKTIVQFCDILAGQQANLISAAKIQEKKYRNAA